MPRRTQNQLKRIGQLMLKAMSECQEREGSTKLQILEYIKSQRPQSSEADASPHNLVLKLHRAMKVALDNGIIREHDGRFKLAPQRTSRNSSNRLRNNTARATTRQHAVRARSGSFTLLGDEDESEVPNTERRSRVGRRRGAVKPRKSSKKQVPRFTAVVMNSETNGSQPKKVSSQNAAVESVEGQVDEHNVNNVVTATKSKSIQR